MGGLEVYNCERHEDAIACLFDSIPSFNHDAAQLGELLHDLPVPDLVYVLIMCLSFSFRKRWGWVKWEYPMWLCPPFSKKYFEALKKKWPCRHTRESRRRSCWAENNVHILSGWFEIAFWDSHGGGIPVAKVDFLFALLVTKSRGWIGSLGEAICYVYISYYIACYTFCHMTCYMKWYI